jgi:transcriptional regulator with XRE-family HTH domain
MKSLFASESIYMVSKFSDRLKDLREEQKLSQRQLAEAVGTSQANISRWEAGTQDPSTEWIVRLAEYFRVTTDYILGVVND